MRLAALAFLGIALSAQTLPNAVPMPTPEIQYLSSTGAPLVGAKLCTYAAGSSTPLATYTDSTAGTPNTNPVVLDANGRASIWVGPALYKFVLRVGGDGTCSTGAVQWSQDNVGDTTLYFTTYVATAGTCTLISFKATGTGAVTRTCSSKLGDFLSVQDFGAKGDGSTDDYAAILAAHTQAVTTGACVLFPAATYLHKTVFSLSDNNTCWIGAPGTRLQYGGSSATVDFTFDGSGTALGKRAVLRDLVFDANSLTDDGVLFRSLNHGEVTNVRVTNNSRDAVIEEGTTLTSYNNVTVSKNVEAFVTTPVRGWVSRAISAGALSGTTGGVIELNNPIIEGVSGNGMDLASHQGIQVNGGASEGNGGLGLKLGSGAILFTAINLDMESNTGGDLDDSSLFGLFANCVFASAVASDVHMENAGGFAAFHGGYVNNTKIEASSVFNTFIGVSFTGTGTQITDSSTTSTWIGNTDAYTSAAINSKIQGTVAFPGSVSFAGGVTGNTNFTGRPIVGPAADDDGVSKFQVYGGPVIFGIPAAANDSAAAVHTWSAGSDTAFGLYLKMTPSATAGSRSLSLFGADESTYRTINFQGAGGRVTFGGATDDGAISVQTTGGFRDTGVLAASLSGHADTNGSIRFCTDCTVDDSTNCKNVANTSACTCVGGGNGAFAKRVNGVWLCN